MKEVIERILKAVQEAKQMHRQREAMAGQSREMAKTANAIDSYRFIRAPFSGYVTKRYISPGQFVTPSTAILGLSQVERIRLQANVAELLLL